MAEALRGAMSLDPDYDVTALDIKNADTWAILGSEALGRKHYHRAEKIFRKAVDTDPDSEAGYFGLGLTLLAEERFVEAESAFQKVVFYDPNNFEAYENLGKISAARGDISNAVFYVEKTLSINPSQPQLIQILPQLEKQPVAKGNKHDNYDRYFGLGTRKAKDGDLEGATAMYLEAAKIRKTDGLMYNLGLVSYRMKKNDDAVIYLKKALAINPEKKDAGSLLRHILKKEQMKKQIRISVDEVQKQ
ncbi:tetratricopeptide repeat protein [bacterium]|nr:tetratricopeptide repeat protein [bacterium]